jgi:hypothetical protein
MDRPLLNEVMRRIDAGESEGVVVFNLSRFCPHLARVGRADRADQRARRAVRLRLRRVRHHDDHGPTGHEHPVVDRAGRAGAVEGELADGAGAGGRSRYPPLGHGPVRLQAGRDTCHARTGRHAPAPLEIDPETAPYVAEVFQRRAAGESWASIRNWLTKTGVPTRSGAGWSIPYLQKVVTNSVYLGIARGAHGGGAGMPGAHPALIDEGIWHAAHQRRGMRADTKTSPTVSRGLVRCPGCRYVMIVTSIYSDPRVGGGRKRAGFDYRC